MKTDEVALSAYSAFALVFLPTAYLSAKLGGFGDVSAYVDTKLLSAALIRASTTNALFTVQPELRLWLLAHFICLQKLQKHTNLDPVYMKALSVLLSSSASEIVDRIDVEESEDQHPVADEDDEGHGLPLPLPRFVKESLVTLVDKQSITGLLEKFNTSVTAHDFHYTLYQEPLLTSL
jgi:ubiquitin-protein ligase E3 C